MYRNGTEVGTALTSSSSQVSVGGPNIGRRLEGSSANDYTGYLDEIRLSTVARYTGNFTAPSAAFVSDSDTRLLIQSKASNLLGGDNSGQGNHFTTNNLTVIDQSTDTCTNNFATWNPLFRKGTTTPAFTEGNLKSTFDDTGANEFALTTFGVSAGKWYAEVKWTANTGTAATATGILDMAYSGTADPNDAVTNAFGYFGSGTKNVSGTASSYGNSYADGNIVGIAIDMDNNKLYFSKNGTFQNSGDPTTGATGTGAIAIVAGVTYGIFATDYNNQVAELNTGSPAFSGTDKADGNGFGSFEYEPPSGYLALCSKNLAEFG